MNNDNDRSAESVPEYLPFVREGFSVTDDSSANWVVRKIKDVRAYASHVKIWAASELRAARRDEEFFFSRFHAQLEDWLSQHLRGDERRRSIKLPAGTVGFRAVPPRILVEDEHALITWCLSNLKEAVCLTVEVSGEDAIALRDWLDHRDSSGKGHHWRVEVGHQQQLRIKWRIARGNNCYADKRPTSHQVTSLF